MDPFHQFFSRYSTEVQGIGRLLRALVMTALAEAQTQMAAQAKGWRP